MCVCACREMMDAMWVPAKYSRAYLASFFYIFVLTLPHSISVQLAYPDANLNNGTYSLLPCCCPAAALLLPCCCNAAAALLLLLLLYSHCCPASAYIRAVEFGTYAIHNPHLVEEH